MLHQVPAVSIPIDVLISLCLSLIIFGGKRWVSDDHPRKKNLDDGVVYAIGLWAIIIFARLI